ncbi:MAG: ATP-binding cassette domain-containing protein [Metamycoplasmataceae bacterium]
MKIIIQDLEHSFDDGLGKEVFKLGKINFSFEQGIFYAIIGPTGSGKTTFIEHLNALSTPDAGEIKYIYDEWIYKSNKKVFKKNLKESKKKNPHVSEIKDEDDKILFSKTIIVKKARKIKKTNEIRKKIGVVFQFAEYQLFEETIEKDIMFGPINMGFSKMESKRLAEEVIEKVGLSKDFLQKSPFSLSGGQKRRVALAGILAMNPDFLIFDEPTAGLDPNGVEEILSLFKKLNEENHTIIIVTHDLDNVLKWTDQTIFFKDGQIIQSGKTIDLLEDTAFLINNQMEPPKVLDFRTKLIEKGMKIGRIKSIDDLANEINKIRKGE